MCETDGMCWEFFGHLVIDPPEHRHLASWQTLTVNVKVNAAMKPKSVSVSCCCCNRRPQMGWHQFILYMSGGPEGESVFSPFLASGAPLPQPPHPWRVALPVSHQPRISYSLYIRGSSCPSPWRRKWLGGLHLLPVLGWACNGKPGGFSAPHIEPTQSPGHHLAFLSSEHSSAEVGSTGGCPL